MEPKYPDLNADRYRFLVGAAVVAIGIASTYAERTRECNDAASPISLVSWGLNMMGLNSGLCHEPIRIIASEVCEALRRSVEQ